MFLSMATHFKNIQPQAIKEVRDEEKWSSIFLYI